MPLITGRKVKAKWRSGLPGLNRQVVQLAREISEHRRGAAGNLEKKVEEKLRPLGMQKAVFSVKVDTKTGANGRPVCGPTGADSIEFLIAPNQGEPLSRLKILPPAGSSPVLC